MNEDHQELPNKGSVVRRDFGVIGEKPENQDHRERKVKKEELERRVNPESSETVDWMAKLVNLG